jgi:hypothetical protein
VGGEAISIDAETFEMVNPRLECQRDEAHAGRLHRGLAKHDHQGFLYRELNEPVTSD